VRKLLVVLALGVFAAALLAGSAAATSGSAGSCGAQAPSEGAGRFGGVISAQAIAGTCAVHNTGDPANGIPPLLYWGGPVMASTASAPTTVTPIFWNPSGHPMTSEYKRILRQYLADVAHDSFMPTNVFSVATEYWGSNGNIDYSIRLGAAVNDTRALPKSACTVASNDTTGIYADGSGYDACVSDEQVTQQIQKVVTDDHLPQNDYSHVYVMFLPKHVESCFLAGQTTSTANGQACTINNQPTAAYCAYHSMMGPNWPAFGTIYANMPFPIYSSPVGFTCGSDAGGLLGGLQSPNNNLDADTEASPTSHEISEAITDPNVYNGWYDNAGYENGDECAYVWGSTAGPFGAEYNQTINGHHYLTQEEFSNIDFFDTGGGCVQGSVYEG
jgi:hypothetical protein